MKIYTWSGFSKRRNSTKQPNIASATEVTVVLKEDTSIENPSFILTSASKPTIDYVKAFDEYYFVSNITCLTHSQWQIDCVMDPMATFKADIVASSQFVVRAASSYDTLLPDPLASMKISNKYSVSTITLSDSPFNTTGCYCVVVKNTKGGSGGMAAHYFMSEATLENFAVFVNQTILGDTTLTDKLKGMFSSPTDSVLQCFWLPVNLTVITQSALVADEQIYLMDIPATYSGTPLKAYRLIGLSNIDTSGDIAVSCDYSDFRRSSQFIKGKVFLPYYGMYDINVADFPESLYLNYTVDIMTGDITCKISASKTVSGVTTIADIATVNYNIAVNCVLSTVANNPNILANIAGAVAAGFAGTVGGALGMVTGLSNAALDIVSPSGSVKGSVQGRSMIAYTTPKLILETFDTIDPANLTVTHGRPVMLYKSLSALSGYVQCANASIDIAGFAGERDAINSFLNGGFYIE